VALRKIYTYGAPVLREKAQAIEDITPEIVTLAEDMIETMRANDGIGLAATQVGETVQLMVVDMTLFDESLSPLALLNVGISDPQGVQVHEEGCLSVPGIRDDVERPDQITVTFTSLDGQDQTITCTGMLSRVIQHEYDHLNGVLFVDRISPFKRNLIASRLKKLAKGELVS
jgi:peptide deformylase